MKEAPHEVLLASAGTGKTFQLTSRYLGLLLAGADPGCILATTFTRKAAGEILDRVFERMVRAADGGEGLAELSEHVLGTATREQCREQLVLWSRALDRFHVGTLDAFFVRLGHLFALDLGLAPSWSIADPLEERRQREQAIGRVLAEGRNEELIELLRAVQRQAGQRSVRQALGRAVEGGRAAFLDSPPEAWTRLVVPEGATEEELAQALTSLEAFQPPATRTGTPNQNWAKALDALRRALANEQWDGVQENGLFKACREKRGSYGSVPTDDLCTVLLPVVRHARHVVLSRVAARTRALRALLERFERALQEVKRERALYGFEDLPRALAPGGPGDEPRLHGRGIDLDFRLDGRIEHLLLDEFQDTSPVQWRVLRETAENVMATGDRAFFCVGDVKQSIYGWRAAEPRLLAEMPATYHGRLHARELFESFRSSEVVLDTLDQVFDSIERTAALADRKPYLEAARRWRGQYRRHTAHKALAGDAWLIEAREPREEEGAWQTILDLVAERTRRLVQSAPRSSVAILVRTNWPIPSILDRLLLDGIRASGEGGNPLVDSQAVLHALSLLHLADHPRDRLARFHVEHGPLWGAVAELVPGSAGIHPTTLAHRLRALLASEGYGALCARLLPRVLRSGEYGEWDRRRFRQLVDLGFRHDEEPGLRADDFLDRVRETRVEDPSLASVKVMTVHAAKGLEFDAVLLPQLDESLHDRTPNVLTRRPTPDGALDFVSHNPGKDEKDWDEQLAALYDEARERSFHEALCVLYVALTRARHHVEMLIPTKPSALSYAQILKEKLPRGGSEESGPAGGKVLWRHPRGSAEWIEAEPAAPPAPEPALPERLGLAPDRAPRSLPRRSPSAEEGGGTVWGRELLRAPSEARSRGTLLHRWLEELEWIEDFRASDDELLALARALEPDEGRAREALAELRVLLAKPAVRAALARPAGGDSLFAGARHEVWREHRFSLILPDAAGREVLWSGAIDRVVVGRSDTGAIVEAGVLDYKTDDVRGPELGARVEFYRPQIEGYRAALAAITGLAPREVGASLLFLRAGRVVPVLASSG